MCYCTSGPGPAWHCYYSLPDTPVLVSVHWRSWDTGIHSCQTPVLVSSEVILLSSDEGWEWHLLVMMVEWLLVTCWLALLVLTSVCNQCVVFERFILCQYHISWLSSNTKYEVRTWDYFNTSIEISDVGCCPLTLPGLVEISVPPVLWQFPPQLRLESEAANHWEYWYFKWENFATSAMQTAPLSGIHQSWSKCEAQ